MPTDKTIDDIKSLRLKHSLKLLSQQYKSNIIDNKTNRKNKINKFQYKNLKQKYKNQADRYNDLTLE